MHDDDRDEPVRDVGGRPTKYRPEYCAAVIADMAAGYSLTAFAGSIGICKRTINEWVSAHPEFADAVGLGKAGRLRKWETMAISVADKGTGGPGASSIIAFGLKNMGDGEWADKTQVEHGGGLSINVNLPDGYGLD